MKLHSRVRFQLFVLLLLSGFFFMPAKGTSQSTVDTYVLQSTDESTATDVSAFLLHDRDTEKYILTVDNPSRRKLIIHFSAGNVKYRCRAALPSFSKPFDLTGVGDGVFTFLIQDRNVRLKADVAIKTIRSTRREITVSSAAKNPATDIP